MLYELKHNKSIDTETTRYQQLSAYTGAADDDNNEENTTLLLEVY